MKPESPKSPTKERVFRAFLWNFSGSASQLVIRILALTVLARLLAPQDFGLVGAALIVIGIGDLLGQLGVTPAIVQRLDLTPRHIRAGFTFTVLAGFAMLGLVLLASYRIALFFGMPDLQPLLAILALSFPLKGFGAVAEGMLQRAMRFKEMALIMLVSYLVGFGGVAIFLAVAGYGAMALVLGQLTQTALMTVSYVLCARHSIRPLIDLPALRQLLGFGLGVSISRIGSYLGMNIDNFIVGRFLGAAALGLYSRAYYFLLAPTNLIGTVADNVLFPAMASVQEDRAKLAKAFQQSVALVAMLTLPLSAFLVVFAPHIIGVLLGPNWTGVVAPFQILALGLVCRTGYKLGDTVGRACGAVGATARRQWLYAAEIAAGAWVGHFWGLEGVALGVLAGMTLHYVVMTKLAMSLVDAPGAPILFAHLRYAAVALLVGIAASGVRVAGGNLPDIVMLLSGAIASAVCVGLLWWIAPRLLGEETALVLKLARSLLRRPVRGSPPA